MRGIGSRFPRGSSAHWEIDKLHKIALYKPVCTSFLEIFSFTVKLVVNLKNIFGTDLSSKTDGWIWRIYKRTIIYENYGTINIIDCTCNIIIIIIIGSTDNIINA